MASALTGQPKQGWHLQPNLPVGASRGIRAEIAFHLAAKTARWLTRCLLPGSVFSMNQHHLQYLNRAWRKLGYLSIDFTRHCPVLVWTLFSSLVTLLPVRDEAWRIATRRHFARYSTRTCQCDSGPTEPCKLATSMPENVSAVPCLCHDVAMFEVLFALPTGIELNMFSPAQTCETCSFQRSQGPRFFETLLLAHCIVWQTCNRSQTCRGKNQPAARITCLH